VQVEDQTVPAVIADRDRTGDPSGDLVRLVYLENGFRRPDAKVLATGMLQLVLREAFCDVEVVARNRWELLQNRLEVRQTAAETRRDKRPTWVKVL
jgi:hypothetical protein